MILCPKSIVAYEAFTHHLDEDYIADKIFVDKSNEKFSTVLDRNYTNFKELYDLIGYLDRAGATVDSIMIFESEEYKEALEQDLTFISNDEEGLRYAYERLIITIGSTSISGCMGSFRA